MSPSTLIILIGAIAVIAWFQLQSLKNKVFCSYNRPSGQEIRQWVKLDQKKVRFDNLEFTILPERHKLMWYKLLWGILGNIGTWVIAYDFTFDSEYPRDPRTYKPSVVNPETRRAMNNSDSWAAYNRSVDKQSGRKQGLSQYYPIIIAALLVGVAFYYLYNQNAANQANIKSLEEAIRLMNK